MNGVTPVLAQRVNAELFNPSLFTTRDCSGATLTIPVGMVSVPVACYGTAHLTQVLYRAPLDWAYADLSYTTGDGYTVNTAAFGAGAWQRTAADYDDHGNVVRQPAAGAIGEITAGGVNPGVADLYATTTGYTAQVPGTGDGWALGSPTTTSTAGITTVTVYDSAGRPTQTRQPMSNGADAGTTTTTVYYTADASAADPRCANTPQWAGLPCATGPAAAASTPGPPANGPATLPATLTDGYSIWLAPTSTTETSGTATRTTTTTSMDAAGRPTRTQTTSTIGGSAARPAVHTHYDPASGQGDYTGPVDQTASQGSAIADADRSTWWR